MHAGFQSVRLKAIESKNQAGTTHQLCWCEFDNPHQATIALCTCTSRLTQSRLFSLVPHHTSHFSLSLCATTTDGLQGYRFDPKAEKDPHPLKISYAKAKAARPPPRGPPQRQDSRGEYRGGGGDTGGKEHNYDDDRRFDDDRRYDDDRRDYRRGSEHNDGYREDYEDSERGEDDVFQRAEQVSMHGITDT